MIRSFALQPAADWPTGFYAAAPGLQLFVVVIAELPKTPETRLLRLLGSRWERFRAVREVLNLPIGDVRRQPVVALLLAFRYFFAAALDVDLQKEEQDIMTQLRQEFELLKANLRSEGRLEGKAEALLAVLSARGLVISDSVRAQIVSCQDLEMLDRWLIRAVSASTASDIVAAA